MNSYTIKLMKYAASELEHWKIAGVTVAADQKEFYILLSQGLCPVCKQKLDVVEHTETDSGFSYRFACGHAYKGISLSDSIKVRDTFGIKQMRKGFGLIKRTLTGYKPSGDSRLSEGVTVDMAVDRENNEYHQRVIDNRTGNILHEEHESLVEHSIKQKQKFSKHK